MATLLSLFLMPAGEKYDNKKVTPPHLPHVMVQWCKSLKEIGT